MMVRVGWKCNRYGNGESLQLKRVKLSVNDHNSTRGIDSDWRFNLQLNVTSIKMKDSSVAKKRAILSLQRICEQTLEEIKGLE